MDKKTEKHILNALRNATITWSVRNEVLNRGRRRRQIGTFKNGKNHYVWERQCDGPCGVWFKQADNLLEVDHIDPVGPFKGNWDIHISRLFCDESNLQALCFVCHSAKTAKDVASMRFERKREFLEEDEEIDGEDLL